MRLLELKIEYHDELNPKIWDGRKLKAEVREKLLQIAQKFEDFIEVEELDVEDVVLTGSMANYNWTNSSDLDLHLIADLDEFHRRCPDLSDDFFRDKKTLWNDNHDITIHDHEVEVYVQDDDEEHIASGVYSILNDEWINEPEHSPPSPQGKDVTAKASQIKSEIDSLIREEGGEEAIDRLKEKIRKMRKAGLDTGGEFSTENLAFKELRKSGYLQKLSDYKKQSREEELSL